ncbi:hypothetical protein M153_7300027404 [Pseudoloma neurophilia]|uniref:Uncharacterized protein n=1 Tax=Pseudoloma neurophilia TaxID=146866 RepID=A0A0R0M5X1_9MICR|nr:hypothetical protein M153_7300027404 [Pseudoloma neurophilia]
MFSKNELFKTTSEELEVSHLTVTKIQSEYRSLSEIYYDYEPLVLCGLNLIM